MQHVTLTIAVVFSVLALTLPIRCALAAYIAALLCYPSYLVVTIGTIDISVGRIVGAVLFLRCVSDARLLSKFAWCRLDTWVTVSMFVYVGVYCVTRPASLAIENRGGFLMDTFLAYAVARLIVTDRATLVYTVKCVGFVLVPLAIWGVIEAKTGWQPFVSWMRFCPWMEGPPGIGDARFGLTRAKGPPGNAILFGCEFAMLLPLVYYLRHEKKYWRPLAYLLSGVVIVGALSSLSSCPWAMVTIAIFCLVMERRKRWVRPLLVAFILSLIVVGIISNRPIHHVVVSYCNPMGGAGWHRAALIDLAIEHFDEWWMFGYKGRDPGWGPAVGMRHTDVTNEYIMVGVQYGVLGIIVTCGVVVSAIYGIIHAYKISIEEELKSLYWALGSLMVAVVVTWMSASFFGTLRPLFYCTLGMIGSLTNMTLNGHSAKWPLTLQTRLRPMYCNRQSGRDR